MAERLKRVEARLLRAGLVAGSIRKTQDTSRPGRERITWRANDTNMMTNVREKDISPLVERGLMSIEHGNYYVTTPEGKARLEEDDASAPILETIRRLEI